MTKEYTFITILRLWIELTNVHCATHLNLFINAVPVVKELQPKVGIIEGLYILDHLPNLA